MNINTSSAAWIALGWTFLHVGWIGLVVGLAASLARRSLRRASAEARHAAALVGLLTLAVSPFVAFAVVYEPVPAPIVPPTGTTARTGIAPQGEVDLIPESVPLHPAIPPQPIQSSKWFDPWVNVLPGVWLAGSLLALLRTAVGLAGVERLRRAAVPLRDGPVAERCRELARSLGIVREVGLAVCDQIAAPLLIGVLRPTILLPAAALTGWAPDQIEMVLLHELAHLRRRDNLTCLFQKLVEALLFFHPTTWWLSAWLRLERETCCDLRVVARTGRPRAYAELLATLAGAGRATPPCPALAERPIATRIRRILFKEDRPMTLKPTAPETLALAAAALLAAALVLPTRAEPPKSKPDTAADLKRIASIVAGLPVPPEPGEHGEPDPRSMALLQIAEKLNTRGDQAGARATLKHIKLDFPVDKDLWRDVAAIARCEVLVERAACQYDAGEIAEARAHLRRLIDLIDRPDPADAAAMQAMARMMRTAFMRRKNDPDGPVVAVVDEAGQNQPVPEKIEIVEALLSITAKHRDVELLDRIAATISRLSEASGDPVLTALLEGHIGAAYLKAGEEQRGRDRITAARKRVESLPASPARAGASEFITGAIMDTDFNADLDLLSTLSSARRNTVLRKILERDDLCAISDRPWDDAEGIKITIGDPALTPKEPVRPLLPRFIALAKTVENDAERARTLAVLAHLQARGGDPAGAMATAEAIPDLRRPEGPVDGFYDSVKPATFALIALRRAEAGDQKAADAAFARSRELTRAVASEPERVIAGIVLAQNLEATGRRDQANAALADAIPLAKTQPEPRRSRMLGMLAETQLKTAGVDAASATIDAIRDEPGIEKAYALQTVARTLHDAGDDEVARRHARRALVCLEPKASDPKPDSNHRVGFSRLSFIDYDAETPQPWLMMRRNSPQATLHELAGDPTPPPAATSPWLRQMNQSSKVVDAFRRGGLDEALKAVATLDTPSAKASALQTLAYHVASDEGARK